jgi:hypothetical protein
MAVTQKEFLWREWFLGEGRFKQYGPRQGPRPDVGYGGPGQRPIPKAWRERLEAFVAKRDKEPARKIVEVPKPPIKKAATTQLSPHFNVREFDCHNGARVPQFAIPALKELAVMYLEPMRAEFGSCIVLSAYRPKAYNAKIGGAKSSQHIYELTPSSVASDITFARGRPRQWAAKARTLADRRHEGGVGQYDNSGFIHIDNGPRRDWWG